ncbi:unnamed protein product [Polarella glacialis]|uniref:Uncharacterized protein n=1 Tax=Polarella glacialis TaxID=89957 RepID=A0A813EZU7_POLGL|nr:unnamed protein product [Polarella glacialis]
MHDATHVREHDAVLQRVVLFPASHQACTHLQESGRFFAADCKNKSEQSSPHLFIWAALIATVGNLPVLTDEQKQILLQHASEMDSPQKLAQSVFVCRLKKAWAKDTLKLTFSTAPSLENLANVICTVLAANGGTVKHGIPPRGVHERAIAKILVEMGEYSSV